MTTQKPDGGFAFPCAAGTPQEGHLQEGMTLRDWFAGMALQGIVSRNTPPDAASPQDSSVERYAFISYAVADAMIAEKNKQ